MARFTFGRSAAISAILLLWPLGSLFADSPAADPPATPEDLVWAALRSELSGPSHERQQWLDLALKHDENFAPARWQSGQVRLDGRWMGVDDVSLDHPANARLAEYRRRRDGMISTAAEHRALAQWCAQNDLPDEARLHWTKVLQFGPDAEAIAALGLNDTGARQAPIGANEEAARLEAWRPVVGAWRDAIVRGTKQEAESALVELRRLSDPAAVPALRALFLQPRAGNQLPLLFVDTASRIPGPDATAGLLQVATWHASPKLRQRAVEVLKQRPKYAVVPRLLASFERPVASRTNVLVLPDGSVFHEHIVQLRGWTDDLYLYSFRAFMSASRDGLNPNLNRTVAADLQQFQLETAQRAAQADANNNRLHDVLAQVLDTDVADPIDWYRTWLRYLEYDTDIPREVDVRFTYHFQSIVSCFPAGTLVSTIDGPRAIETIKPGDRVLSQDVDTGRLDYKLVYDVTLRPKVPMLRVGLGPETITSTRGHHFWVNGRGWMMAKELEPGMVLHGLRGAVVIDSVEPAGLKPSYNLVVGGYNTYYVGREPILVHDNMPPVEPSVTVPGLFPSRLATTSAP